jgi:hypothetical protein
MGHKLVLAAVPVLMLWGGTAEAALLPKLPTGYAAPVNLANRPSRILITGDGSGLLGGFTGHQTANKRNARWGRLHWTKWRPGRGYATGAEWIDNGIPDVATGIFHPYTAAVLAFRPPSRRLHPAPCRLHRARLWAGDWSSDRDIQGRARSGVGVRTVLGLAVGRAHKLSDRGRLAELTL